MKFLRAMKKIKKQIIAAVMACVLGIGGIYSVHASVINDAKNKKNEAQQELDNLNSQIDEIQAAQSDLQEEMDAYDDQLMALLTDMDLLENDMTTIKMSTSMIVKRIRFSILSPRPSVWCLLTKFCNYLIDHASFCLAF